MNPVFKSLLTNALPPFLLNALSSISGRRSRWTGNYPDWASASAETSGYDANIIFDVVRKAAAAVRDGEALWERDSTCFYHEEYNWQLLACLMTAAASSEGSLHVLDFGGALGSVYMQHRKILSELQDCSWSVVEQPHVVACGRDEFSTASLKFYETIEKCFSNQPVNVVLFSSVLQYVEDPYELLKKVVKMKPNAIIIDRTPLASEGERITVQRVPSNIYSASYPCRFLNRDYLQTILTDSRTLTPWFKSAVDPADFFGVMSLRDGYQ